MNSYTLSIQKELMDLKSYDEINQIKKTDLNSTILSHLEMTDDLIVSIRDTWNDAKIFYRIKRDNLGNVIKDSQGMPIKEDSYCVRSYVQDVIIKYCQNRHIFKNRFNLTGMVLIDENASDS